MSGAFHDPSGTVDLRLPEGWALDLASSTLLDLVFTAWTSPAPHTLFVRLRPAVEASSPEAWLSATATRLPPDAESVHAVQGGQLWAVVPGHEGRPDQRWVTCRGTRVDVRLEEVGAGRGGALRTPLLQQGAASLHVPANGPLPVALGSWEALLGKAQRELQANDPQAGDSLLAAHRWAIAQWQQGLAGGGCETIQLLHAVEALLGWVGLTRNLAALDDATNVLMRTLPMLEATEHQGAAPTRYLALRLHGVLSGQPPPLQLVTAALQRAELAVSQLLSTSSETAGPAAALALGTATSCVVMSDRLAGKPQEQQAIEDFRERSLTLLSAASMGVLSHRVALGLSPDPSTSHDWLTVAREVRRRAPGAASTDGEVLALVNAAGAALRLDDVTGLEDAHLLMVQAQDLLPQSSAVLSSQVWLDSAWITVKRGLPEQALREAARVTDAGPAMLRSRAAIESTALLLLGQLEPALQRGSAAVGPDDPVESAHRMVFAAALYANDRSGEAIEQGRLGLLAALAENPFSDTVLRLLGLLGDALPQDSSLALRATAVAADLLLYEPRWHADQSYSGRYDEIASHRQAAASLVLRRYRAGDLLGALAAADRARARTLAPGYPLTGPGDERLPGPTAPGHGTTLPDLLELVGVLVAAELRRIGIPDSATGERLCELVDGAGRTTLVLHPTPEGLVRFLLRPHQQPVVSVTDATGLDAATDELRRSLAITLVQRAARGSLPRANEQEVLTALAAWGEQDPLGSDSDPLDTARHELHRRLLGGLDLERGEALAVVPYRELALLPVGALLTESGEPVLLRHPVSLMPSIASTLGRPPRVPDRPFRALVVGDPLVAASEDLPPLLGARGEATDIAALLGADLLMGERATESALRERAAGARLLHLACHAAVAEPAERSSLFLAPGPNDDGRFQVSEAADLRLDDALVVLAACETGLGRITPDGVQGLGRAFAQAGARCVLLSLWRVGDASTSLLMRELYRGLLGADGHVRLDAAEALARAQEHTRETYPDVAQWGPWVIVGDGGWRLE